MRKPNYIYGNGGVVHTIVRYENAYTFNLKKKKCRSKVIYSHENESNYFYEYESHLFYIEL